MMKRDEKKQKQGRGQGDKLEYTPYIRVQESKSSGRLHRITGLTISRMYHFLSDLEANVFRLYDWCPAVVDIREQYPLHQPETLKIADELGIKHPTHPDEREPIVMTTDLMLTIKQKGDLNEKQCVRTIKPAKRLSNNRVIEKLEIERVYFERRKIDWGIVTQEQLPTTLTKNLEYLYDRWNTDELDLSQEQTTAIRNRLHAEIKPGGIILSQVALEIDNTLGIREGSALAVANHLIITRQWYVDLNKLFKPSRKMEIVIV